MSCDNGVLVMYDYIWVGTERTIQKFRRQKYQVWERRITKQMQLSTDPLS